MELTVWACGRKHRGRPAVVLEPGLGASSVGWSRVRDGLSDRTRVITYDRAGLGTSPPTTGRRGLDLLAADLARVIRAHGGGGPVVLVGHSLGATLARRLAATEPDLVAGLVLIDPIPERWVLHHGRWAAPLGQIGYLVMETLARQGLIDTALALPVMRGITRSSTSPLAPFTAAERDLLAAEMRNPRSHSTARRELTGLLRHSRSALRALTADPVTQVPLTVISGAQTSPPGAPLRRAATRWHAGLVAANPCGNHLVVDDGGHFIPRYRPDVVITAVADLFDRIGRTRPRIRLSDRATSPPSKPEPDPPDAELRRSG